jgi:hypothetical protein
LVRFHGVSAWRTKNKQKLRQKCAAPDSPVTVLLVSMVRTWKPS